MSQLMPSPGSQREIRSALSGLELTRKERAAQAAGTIFIVLFVAVLLGYVVVFA